MPDQYTPEPIEADVVEQAMTISDDGLRELVLTMAVPVLVADYRPVIRRHAGKTVEEVTAALDDNQELLTSVGLLPAIGGRLDLDVEDGVGSTFTVRLPIES